MSRNGVLRLAFLFVVIALLAAVTAEAAGPFQFFSVTPCRFVRTTAAGTPPGAPPGNGPPALSSGNARNFQVNGLCGVPATAAAATVNVTFITPTADGFLKIYPFCDPLNPPPGGCPAPPTVSTVNALAGEPAIANGAIVPLTAGTLNITVVYGSQVVGSTANVIMDVTGYFQ
jgi:hypothetical protein